jgi:hypothetical protein
MVDPGKRVSYAVYPFMEFLEVPFYTQPELRISFKAGV